MGARGDEMIKDYIKKCMKELLTDEWDRKFDKLDKDSISTYQIQQAFRDAFTDTIKESVNTYYSDQINNVISQINVERVLKQAIEEHLKEKYKTSLDKSHWTIEGPVGA